MPFARIDLIQGKSSEYRAAVADIVYRGIVDVLEAPDGDRFVVVGEHTADNLIYDPKFLGFSRSPDFILIQVTSTVGNKKDTKFAFYRFVADELQARLSVRPEGKPQERVLSMAGFLGRYGWDLLDTLAEHIDGWYARALEAADPNA